MIIQNTKTKEVEIKGEKGSLLLTEDEYKNLKGIIINKYKLGRESEVNVSGEAPVKKKEHTDPIQCPLCGSSETEEERVGRIHLTEREYQTIQETFYVCRVCTICGNLFKERDDGDK